MMILILTSDARKNARDLSVKNHHNIVAILRDNMIINTTGEVKKHDHRTHSQRCQR